MRRAASNMAQPNNRSRVAVNTRHPRLSGGRRRGFVKHCFAPPQPAGCAKPAVERGVGA